MKIVPLNEVKNQFSQYLEEAQREDIVVTKNGRAAAIIHAITDEDLEDYLYETAPRFHSPQSGKITTAARPSAPVQ